MGYGTTIDLMRSRREVVGGAVLTAGVALIPGVAFAATDDDLPDILAKPGGAAALHAAIGARLGPGAGERAANIRRWARIFPDEAAQVQAGAEPAMQGLLTLPGTGGRPGPIGSPPTWSRNPTRSSEWIASLNRMPHWHTLLTAWALTGNRAYPDKVVAELDDWIATQQPPALGDPKNFVEIAPWRALEVGIRMSGSWPFLLRMLAGTEWMPADRLARFVRACHNHGQVLATVSPKLWPGANHNHYLTEMTGLLTLAGLLPELKQAESWRGQGWREVARCAEVQITAEGGQVEGCPHYHAFCMMSFFQALAVGRSAGLTPDAAFAARMKAAAMYSLHSTRPTGDNVPWGDSDTSNYGVEAIVAASAALDYWEPLAGVRSFVTSKRIESAVSKSFFDAAQPVDWVKKVIAMRPAPPDKVLWARALNQAMMRNNWSAGASSVFFACRSPVFGGHSHIDPAGFDYCSQGRPILVDPGRYTYAEGMDRRTFKSAMMHNTVTINEREPFEYLSSWQFGPQKEGRIAQHYSGAGFQAFEALNRNYDPPVHRRLLILRDAGDLIVLDALENLHPSDTVQLWYHFDSLALAWRPDVASAITKDADKPNVSLTVTDGLIGSVTKGKISAFIDQRRDSRRLRLESTGSSTSRTFLTHVKPLVGDLQVIRLKLARSGNVVRFTIGSEKTMLWTLGVSLMQV